MIVLHGLMFRNSRRPHWRRPNCFLPWATLFSIIGSVSMFFHLLAIFPQNFFLSLFSPLHHDFVTWDQVWVQTDKWRNTHMNLCLLEQEEGWSLSSSLDLETESASLLFLETNTVKEYQPKNPVFKDILHFWWHNYNHFHSPLGFCYRINQQGLESQLSSGDKSNRSSCKL